MFRFLVKLPRHKNFNYTPVYYDEAKEELNERIARAEAEAKGEKYTGTLKAGSLRSSWERGRGRIRQSNRTSYVRFVSILFVLFLLTYLILK